MFFENIVLKLTHDYEERNENRFPNFDYEEINENTFPNLLGKYFENIVFKVDTRLRRKKREHIP